MFTIRTAKDTVTMHFQSAKNYLRVNHSNLLAGLGTKIIVGFFWLAIAVLLYLFGCENKETKEATPKVVNNITNNLRIFPFEVYKDKAKGFVESGIDSKVSNTASPPQSAAHKDKRNELKLLLQDEKALKEHYRKEVSKLRKQVVKLESENFASNDGLRKKAIQALVSGNYMEADSILEKIENSSSSTIAAASYAACIRGQISQSLFDYEKTLKRFQRAAQLRPDCPLYQKQVGHAALILGDLDETVMRFDWAYKLLLQIHEAPHPALAAALNDLGIAWHHKGDLDKALNYYQQAQAIDEELQTNNPATISARLSNIGAIWTNKRLTLKGLESYKQAESIVVNSLGNQSKELAPIRNNIASALNDMGDFAGAIDYYNLILGNDPAQYNRKDPNTSLYLQGLGIALIEKGDCQEGVEHINTAMEISTEHFGASHPYIALHHNGFGLGYKCKGDITKAIQSYRDALSMNLKYLDADHHRIAGNRNNLAIALICDNSFDEAIRQTKLALQANKKHFGSDSLSIASNYNTIGLAYQRKGYFQRAARHYLRALLIEIDFLGFINNRIATRYSNLASAESALGDHSNAISDGEMALRIRSQLYGDSSLPVGHAQHALAIMRHCKGDNAVAKDLFIKASEIFIEHLGPDHRLVNNLAIDIKMMDEWDTHPNRHLKDEICRNLSIGELKCPNPLK